MKMRTICILSLLFALLATAAWAAADAHGTQEALAGKLIRLHVVANSDSQADQALKLLVRDAVLEEAQACLKGCAAAETAEERLTQLLPELEALAASTAAEQGFDYPARATLAWEAYPTREYATFSLPAGRYLSLRVTLGAGEGHNWWCVVFPPLCLSATTEDFTGSALEAGLTGEEVSLITRESGGYAVRFKLIEWVERLLADQGS